MSYSIRYQASKNFEEKFCKKHSHSIICGAAAVLFVVIAMSIPESKQVLWDVFFPGAGETVFPTMREAITAIREGEPVLEVLSAFCHEVIQNSYA